MGRKRDLEGKDDGNLFLLPLMALLTMKGQAVRNRSIYVVVASGAPMCNRSQGAPMLPSYHLWSEQP